MVAKLNLGSRIKMKMRSFVIIILFLFFSVAGADEPGVGISECEKAGGILTKIKECDNSESDWCAIPENEECYADQVKDGRCTVVNLSPRVLCDKEQ